MGERRDRGCRRQHGPREQRSIGSGRTVVGDDVCPGHEKKIAIDIPKEIRLGEPICDISTMICNSMNNKTQAIGSKR